MHRSFLIVFVLFFSVVNTFAQNKYDILHTTEGTKEVKIRELGEAEIKFSYPNEETIYTLNKFLVKKIQFASGREEVIEIPFKEVNGLNDSDNIYVTYNPIEVDGLFNLGDLFSKATGATVFSSMSNVKNRSLDKMKAEAAMLGANVILIADAQSRGHYYGNQYTPS